MIVTELTSEASRQDEEMQKVFMAFRGNKEEALKFLIERDGQKYVDDAKLILTEYSIVNIKDPLHDTRET